jgi:hypothetical protein
LSIPPRSDVLKKGRRLSWSKLFVPAIPLPEGGELRTLDDSRRYILDLPEDAQRPAAWQNATEALLLVGQNGGPEMFARVGMMYALYPKTEPAFDASSRKEHHWGRRKLARDR